VTTRVSPTERIHAQIDELFASEGDLRLVLEQVARLGARLLLQSALEAEVTEFLGRDRSVPVGERRERPGGLEERLPPPHDRDHGRAAHAQSSEAAGHHPAVRVAPLGKGVTRTNAIESLVIAGYVRGLSTRHRGSTR